MGAVQLGQFQPTLHREWSATQLIALLNLSMLFNDSVVFHDTQLLDNPYILEAFRDRHRPASGITLFRQIRDAMREGLLDVGIRDGMLIARDNFVEGGSLEAVALAWIRQNLSGVGRVRQDQPFRADVVELARDLDWVISRGYKRPIEYSYIDVKASFQERIRLSANASDSPVSKELAGLPSEFVSSYHEILEREWFSHTDLFHLVREIGLGRSLMTLQGFLDEAAYSFVLGVDLSGSDEGVSDRGRSAEGLFETQDIVKPTSTIEELLAEHASRVIRGPSVEALALLGIADIVELRASGADARALRARNVGGAITSRTEDVILEAFDDYWRSICRHIKTRYPMASVRPSRILVFLRNRLPRVADLFVRGTRFAHQVAGDVIKSVPAPSGASAALGIASKYVGLEFILFAEDDALRALRSTLPRSTWRVVIR